MPVEGAVMTYFTPEGPISPLLTRGQVFHADATMGSTVEKLIGLDYSISGPVTVLSRDTSRSFFSDTLSDDPTLSGVDQGAIINDVSKPLDPGFYPLARYTLQINKDAPLGMNSININGIAWSDEFFQDHPLDSNGGFQVNVVPETSCLALGMGTIMFLFTQRKAK